LFCWCVERRIPDIHFLKPECRLDPSSGPAAQEPPLAGTHLAHRRRLRSVLRHLTFMGMGADVYGSGTLTTGSLFAPDTAVFVYRHYLRDKGHFPAP